MKKEDDITIKQRTKTPSTLTLCVYYTLAMGIVLAICLGITSYGVDKGETKISENAIDALKVLRRVPASDFHWSTLPILGIVVYIYINELCKIGGKRVVFAGLWYLLVDVLFEIVNVLLFQITGFSCLWLTPYRSSVVLLLGVNIEIILLFSLIGIMLARLDKKLSKGRNAEKDKDKLKLKLQLSIGFVVIGVSVEMWLNYIGMMPWDFPLWSSSFPFFLPFWCVLVRNVFYLTSFNSNLTSHFPNHVSYFIGAFGSLTVYRMKAQVSSAHIQALTIVVGLCIAVFGTLKLL